MGNCQFCLHFVFVKMEQELFDVILGTLNEKGYIQTWKSDMMCRAVKPLYTTGVLPRRKVLKSDSEDDFLKLHLLMDLLTQLGLDNTRKMLLTEVDAGDEDLVKGVADLSDKKTDAKEPLLHVLMRIAGHFEQEDETAKDQERLPDPNSSSKDLENEDLFETAIEEQLGDLTIGGVDDPVHGLP